MVKNVILQFDKDSDNSKIEVVQNLNKCPQLSHMDAESSHDRRRVILTWAGSARAELSVSRIDWHLSLKYLCSGLILPAQPGYRATDAADVLQSRMWPM